MTQVSVVIPAVEFDSQLANCLKSLDEQKNVSLEAWVIFNPKLPNIKLGEWPKWIHFLESKKGVNSARNLGLANCSNDLVLFLDSDCQLTDTNHIEKLCNFLAKWPDATGVGGGYQISKNAKLPTQAYNYLQMEWLRQQISEENFGTQALIGGHMLLRKSKLGEVKFDENIIFGGSEKEFFARLKKTQNRFYVDLSLNVQHNSELTEQELFKKAKAQGIGEKYTRNLHGKIDKQKFCYLIKPDFDPRWSTLIEKYQTLFSRATGQDSQKVNPIRKSIYGIIEHLMVSQSSRD